MTEETAQDAPAVDDVPAGQVPAGVGAPADEAPSGTGPDGPADRPVRAPRRRRAPKQDPQLVADVATARAGVEQIAAPGQIGAGHRVVVEEDRLVVHLFECALPGYRGWNWFASLARAPRSRAVTVCEVGLLPGEDALLAPEWVPWAQRVSPEEQAQRDAEDGDAAEEAAEGGADAAADVEPAATPEGAAAQDTGDATGADAAGPDAAGPDPTAEDAEPPSRDGEPS